MKTRVAIICDKGCSSLPIFFCLMMWSEKISCDGASDMYVVISGNILSINPSSGLPAESNETRMCGVHFCCCMGRLRSFSLITVRPAASRRSPLLAIRVMLAGLLK